MAAAHSASGHASQRGANMHYPQQLPASPGSPTLTNPDMILPDYDRAASPDLPQSALMWKTDHHSNMQFSLSSQGFVAGPITPTTPIIYGNGTMLSDIGEVTEVESTVGKPTYQHGRRFSEDSIDARVAIRSSPTMGKATGPYESVRERARKANYERRSSIESTSTITTQDRNAIFADFDDSVSVGDSNFQGDDEESLASSYHDDDDEPQVSDDALKSRLSSGTLRSEDRFSTMSLSKRAEEILANAKRRLTTMEGNLSRARSVVSPLRSIDPDTPSPPPFERPSTVMETPTTMTTTTTTTTTTTSSNSHTRMMSETGMALTTEIQAGVYPRRSASALGVAGGYRRPLQTLQGSRSFDHMRDRDTHIKDSLSGGFEKANVKALPPHEPALSPLTEDDIPPRDDLLMPEDKGSKLETFLSPTFGSFQMQSAEEIPRAASAAQVRDLKHQMKDLKGKISSLREQARVDSLKRRSLQSLRTPSPFTHSQVDQWYAEHRAYKATNSNLNEERSPWNGEEESAVESQQHGSGSDPAKPTYDVDSPEDSIISEGALEFRGLSPPKLPMNNSGAMGSQTSLAPHHIPAPIVEEAVEDEDDMKTEDGIEGYDEEEFNSAYENESESGDSLYHEAVQEQISHEDREDAFDYEHFFLHSAMGTIRRRDTMDSYSSEGSVETTKGPIISSTKEKDKPQKPTVQHVRSDSVASTSTMESFATATEGRHSVIYEDVMEDYVEQVVTLPPKSRSSGERTPLTAKRTSFSPPVSTSNVSMHKGRSSLDESRSQYREKNPNVVRRPNTSADNYNMRNMHRPSVSSFESVGTTRSFPLVNRPKNGILTPQGSPDSELKTISDNLLNETASICESKHSGAPIDVLAKDDQILVQRLVESLGKCVLGLSENSKASSEARMYRRRVEAARRLLEGLEGPA